MEQCKERGGINIGKAHVSSSQFIARKVTMTHVLLVYSFVTSLHHVKICALFWLLISLKSELA